VIAKTLLFLCTAVAAFAADYSLIRERMKDYVDRGTIPGAVTLVRHKGEIVAFDATGYQDIEAKTPMTKDSIFQVMSMTKPFTGVSIMMLLEEGKLALNDAVEKHLPEFRGQMAMDVAADGKRTLRKPSRPITIRDLMTHTSGMTGPPEGLKELHTRMDKSLADAVLVYSQTPLAFDPGTKWQYSNTGIATLGRVVEVLSKMKFEDFLAQRIFQPLGMKDSHIFLPESKHSRLAAVYHIGEDNKLHKSGAEILGGYSLGFRKGAVYAAPEFALYTTASDLANFYQMMLNGGIYGGKRLISRASVETMTMVHTGDLKAGHMPGTAFGLTWEVVKDPLGSQALLSKGTFGHGGAFGTHGFVDPNKGLVGVFLIQMSSNASDAKYSFMSIAEAKTE
jgi:CubicO group peptidase (beta-lactamase class C family)